MNAPIIPKSAIFLTNHDPECTTYGAGQRTHFLVKALAQICKTDVVLFSETSDISTASKLPPDLGGGSLYRIGYIPNTIIDRSWNAFPSNQLAKRLSASVNLDLYDLIFCRYITPLLKCKLPIDKQIIVDFDDPIYHVPWSSLRSPSEIVKESIRYINHKINKTRLRSRKYRNISFLFVCDRDRTAFPQLRSTVLSNIPVFPKQSFPYTPSTAKTLVFIGLMSWQPNILAVENFLENIWPIVLRQIPDAMFIIIGKGSNENIARWNSAPNCFAKGFVDDIAAVYKDSAVFVVPVFSGGGSNIKVPEALAYQRPLVTTEYSYQGWSTYFTPGEDLLVASTNTEFAAHCIKLLSDADFATRITEIGHKKTSSSLSFNALSSRLREFVLGEFESTE